ncbi:hypothetical protein C6P41_004946 [Kluyveromyces marxianus]|nr:hypothetical protein C6P41_004946 [Kluyveromyces marxianus]
MPNTKTYRTHRTHSRSLPRRSIPHRLAPPSQQAKDDKNNNLPMATFQNENGNMNPFEPVPITFYYVVFPHNDRLQLRQLEIARALAILDSSTARIGPSRKKIEDIFPGGTLHFE